MYAVYDGRLPVRTFVLPGADPIIKDAEGMRAPIEFMNTEIGDDSSRNLESAPLGGQKTQWERVPCPTDGGRRLVRAFALPGTAPNYEHAESMRAPLETMTSKIGGNSWRNFESPLLAGQETQWVGIPRVDACNQPMARTLVPLEAECSTHTTSKRQLLTNVNTKKGEDSSRNYEPPHHGVHASQWEVARDQASKQGYWGGEQRTHPTVPEPPLLDPGHAHAVRTTDDLVEPLKKTLPAATEKTETSIIKEKCHIPLLWTLAQKADMTLPTPLAPRPHTALIEAAADACSSAAEDEMTEGTVRVKEENMGDADLCPTSIPSCLVPAQEKGLEVGESDGHHTPPPEHGPATGIRTQMGSAGRVTIEPEHTERPTPA